MLTLTTLRDRYCEVLRALNVQPELPCVPSRLTCSEKSLASTFDATLQCSYASPSNITLAPYSCARTQGRRARERQRGGGGDGGGGSTVVQ